MHGSAVAKHPRSGTSRDLFDQFVVLTSTFKNNLPLQRLTNRIQKHSEVLKFLNRLRTRNIAARALRLVPL
jgi:hypothetical protein